MWTFSSLPCVLCLLYSWISAEQTIKLCSNTIVCSSPRTTVFQTLPFFRPVSVQTVSWFGWSWQAEFKPHYLAKKEVSSLLVLVTESEYFMQITRSDEQLNWGLSTSIWNISAALSLPWASFVLCLVRGPGIASVFAQNIPCSPLSSCFWDALTMFMWRNSILAWACGLTACLNCSHPVGNSVLLAIILDQSCLCKIRNLLLYLLRLGY